MFAKVLLESRSRLTALLGRFCGGCHSVPILDSSPSTVAADGLVCSAFKEGETDSLGTSSTRAQRATLCEGGHEKGELETARQTEPQEKDSAKPTRHRMITGDGYGGEGLTIRPASDQHKQTLIFMHGLGDTAHGWADAWQVFCQSKATLRDCQVILPTAPTRPITMNGGFPMPAWADIIGLSDTDPEDVQGLLQARERIHSIIKGELQKGIKAQNIIIGGFSQGGAMAYLAALTFDLPIGGVIALSTWMPLYKQQPDLYNGVSKSQALRNVPVIHCHGQDDPLVSYQYGLNTVAVLKTLGLNVKFCSYPILGHSSSGEELEDVVEFISRVFQAQS